MTVTEGQLRLRRKWAALALRVGRLLRRQQQTTGQVVQASYDRIAGGYDQAWTRHMRDLTDSMLARLDVRRGDRGV